MITRNSEAYLVHVRNNLAKKHQGRAKASSGSLFTAIRKDPRNPRLLTKVFTEADFEGAARPHRKAINDCKQRQYRHPLGSAETWMRFCYLGCQLAKIRPLDGFEAAEVSEAALASSEVGVKGLTDCLSCGMTGGQKATVKRRTPMRRLIYAGTFVAAALFLSAGSAQAAEICVSCSYISGAVGTGTYIGTYNPDTFDSGDFRHAGVPNGTAIDDRWVFDIAPDAGEGSVSADFTASAAFAGFAGALYNAGGGTTCAGAPGAPTACSAADLGGIAAGDIDGSVGRVETGIVNLAAGRYIFRLTGTASGQSLQGTYTGQIGTFAEQVPEPAALSLLGIGLAIAARRRRKA